MSMKVCHVTSVHKPTDARIFEHECTSLAKIYDVTLIAPNVDDYECNGVHVKGVSLPAKRFKRQRSLNSVLKKMKEVNADLYHFHDPELIPLGLKIQKQGKYIVFDSHEDVPAQLLSKPYIPTSFLRKIISRIYAFYEKKKLSKYDGLVSVTPSIVDRLRKINPNTVMLTNYPVYEDLPDNRQWGRKIGFVGMIDPHWNIHSIVKAIEDLDVAFELAGPCPDSYLKELESLKGWSKVNYYGVIKHSEVYGLLEKCSVGMALASDNNPNGNKKEGSIGVTKLFEYMFKGLPVISSEIYSWEPIIKGYECGVFVDYKDVQQIREKIAFLISNQDEARRMGDNGKKAVKKQYCWQTQEPILFELYNNILSK